MNEPEQLPSLLDLDARAVAVREAQTEALRAEVWVAMAAERMGPGAVGQIASTFKCSRQRVYTLALVGREVPLAQITPELPLSLLRACIEAAHETTQAVADVVEDAISKGLSARQVRDAADLRKGRRVATTAWAEGEADVLYADLQDGVITLAPDHMPSGEEPRRVRFRLTPVLAVTP